MQPIHLKAGARIFAPGEPSDAVFIIEHGTVVITIGDPLAPTEVARLGPGELFGESGVLENRPHAATASALTDASLLAMPAEAFLNAFGMKNDKALTLVRLICRRLRQATHHPPRPLPNEKPDEVRLPPIRLAPNHPLLSGALGVQSVRVDHLPFQVGNRQAGDGLTIGSNHSLTIQAHGHSDLAAPHFEILRRDGRIGIRDMGTMRGTIVNGTALGRGKLDTFAPLRTGQNQVIAGGAMSPFRFTVMLQA